MAALRAWARQVAGLAIGFFLGATAGWLARSDHAQMPMPAFSLSNSAAEFLQQANIESAESNQTASGSHRVALLQEVALDRQRQQPASVRAAWGIFRDSLRPRRDEGSEPQQDQLEMAVSSLISYQDNLDAILRNSDSIHTFDEIWQVKQEVVEAIGHLRPQLVEKVRKQVPTLPEGNRASDLQQAGTSVVAFARFATANRHATMLLVATMSETGRDIDLQELLALENRLVQIVQTSLADTKVQVEADRRQLVGDKSLPVEPAETVKPETPAVGKCELWLLQLSELGNALTEADLGSWQQAQELVGSDAPKLAPAEGSRQATPPWQQKDGGLGSTIAELRSQLRQLQVLTYNYWALRELEAAETVAGWDGRLARIDAGLLEPTVSALYSSVYGRRIEEIKDSEQRGRTVQRLLRSERIPATAF